MPNPALLPPHQRFLFCAGYTESCDGKCAPSCKAHWSKLDSDDFHCYHWGTLPTTWSKAEEICRDQGGHLASITSEALQLAITAEFQTKLEAQTQMWIGGIDQYKDGQWKWTDCSKWDYEKAMINNKPGEHCLQILRTGGDWDKDVCTNEHYYLCSQKLCSGEIKTPYHICITFISASHSLSGPESSLLGAGVAGGVIRLLIIIALVAFVVYKKRNQG